MELPVVAELELLDITHNNMVVRWKAAQGASGYMILYAPLTEGDPADEKEVCVCVCEQVFHRDQKRGEEDFNKEDVTDDGS